jgi:hypothetical protein
MGYRRHFTKQFVSFLIKAGLFDLQNGIYREGAERWLKIMSEYRMAERIFV